MYIYFMLVMCLLIAFAFHLFVGSSKIEGGASKHQGAFNDKLKTFEPFFKATDLMTNLITTYDEIDDKISFVDTRGYMRPDGHVGQRKLFIAAYQFLKLYPNEKYLVYAGSAPNNYAWLLHDCFPTMKFIYIDPRPHAFFETDSKHQHISISRDSLDKIKTGPNTIYVLTEYFDSELAKMLSDLECLFMCDIRSVYGPGTAEEGDVCNNLGQQALWFDLINAKASSLKFRVPFTLLDKSWPNSSPKMQTDLDLASARGYNIIDNIKSTGKFRYFEGTIYLQAYAGCMSAETRLVINRGAKYVDYDNLEFEARLFYYNLYVRNSLERDTDLMHDLALELSIVGPDLMQAFNDLTGRYYGTYRASTHLGVKGIDLYKFFYDSYSNLEGNISHQVEVFDGKLDDCLDTNKFIQYIDEDLHKLWLIERFKMLGTSKYIVTDMLGIDDEFPSSTIIYIGRDCPPNYKTVEFTSGLISDGGQLDEDRLLHTSKISSNVDGVSMLIFDLDSALVSMLEPIKLAVTCKYPGAKLRGQVMPSPYLDVGMITYIGYGSDQFNSLVDPRQHKTFFNLCHPMKHPKFHHMLDYHYSSSCLDKLSDDLMKTKRHLDRLASKYWCGWVYDSKPRIDLFTLLK